MNSNPSEENRIPALVWIRILVFVLPLVSALIIAGVGMLGDQIASQAGYEHSKDGWHTDNPERVVAAFTIWLVVVTTILASFTAALFIATYALFKTAATDGERALRQSRELFVAERRPWISVLPVIDPETRVQYGVTNDVRWAEVHVSLVVKNIGLTPALRVGAGILDEVVLAADADEVTAKLEEIMARGLERPHDIGQTLFPNDDYTLPSKAYRFPVEVEGKAFKPFIAGLGYYCIGTDPMPHFTPFVWSLKQDADNIRSNYKLVRAGKTLPPT